MEEPLSILCDALNEERLLLVWADVPFPPEGAVRDRVQLINHWKEKAKALLILPVESTHGKRWRLVGLAPLPILSLDPTGRVETTFRYAGVPLKVVYTRRDLQSQDVTLAMASSPSVGFSQLQTELVAPAIQAAKWQFIIGAAGYAWPKPLIRLEAGIEEVLASLSDAAISPPLESVQRILQSRGWLERQAGHDLVVQRPQGPVRVADHCQDDTLTRIHG